MEAERKRARAVGDRRAFALGLDDSPGAQRLCAVVGEQRLGPPDCRLVAGLAQPLDDPGRQAAAARGTTTASKERPARASAASSCPSVALPEITSGSS